MAAVGDPLTGDPAPGGSTFIGFAQNVSTDGGEVAFSAAGSGFIGLFVSDPSGLCRVIDTNDTLEGKDVTQVFMGRDSYSVGMLSFRAVFFRRKQGDLPCQSATELSYRCASYSPAIPPIGRMRIIDE